MGNEGKGCGRGGEGGGLGIHKMEREEVKAREAIP